MNIGTRVRNKQTNKFGHIIADQFGCCGETEELVVYDDSSFGLGTDRELLIKASGASHVPDMQKCGAGKGKECCIFLTVGVDGPCCERFTPLRNALIFKKMTAERDPEEPYPKCMKFE